MSGAVKAVKNVVGGVFGGSDAARRASEASVAGTQAGLAESRRQFDIGQKKLDPFLAAGRRATTKQEELLGLLGADRQEAAFGAFKESPGQKFLRERGERSLLRNASAIGGLGGGNVRQALQEQGIGVAGQQLGDFQNRLASLGSLGGGAAQTSAGLGSQFGQQQLAGQQAIGQQRASGILGAQQANAALAKQVISTGVGAAAGGGAFGAGAQGAFGGSAGSGALAGLLSDKNMKEDVKDLDLSECFNKVKNMDLKSWRYLHEAGLDRDIHFGPMAQDAPECIKISGKEMLNLHDEIMLIAGALQHAVNQGIVIQSDKSN